jgi:hypothetical protein
VHILNTGPAREATIARLPTGKWRSVTTTETVTWEERANIDVAAPLALPARSFITLVREK